MRVAHPAGAAAPSWPFGILGMLCMTVFLVEGSMMDWSAVMLTENHGMPVAQAGYPCLRLVRIAVGALNLWDLGLAPGEWRFVSPSALNRR